MFDVTAIGELIIDFTPVREPEAANPVFEQNPGGAPANLLAAVARLGGSGAFIGKVGSDKFGRFLEQVLAENKVETRGLKISSDTNTTLAFVHLDEQGDRSFSFYRNPGADIMLGENDIDYSLIDNSRIFHFGSLSMTHEPARNATLKAVQYAVGKNKIVSYDPNWRPPLWESEKAAVEQMKTGLQYAGIVKLSEEELELLTGIKDPAEGSKKLLDTGIRMIAVTLGADGCYYRNRHGSGHLATYDVKVVDTTGSGDAFFGAMLYRICRLGIEPEDIGEAELKDIVSFSNAAGSLCATKRGAIPAMPALTEIEQCINIGTSS